LLRGLRTLDVRVRAQAEVAALLAARFAITPPFPPCWYPAAAIRHNGRGAPDERLRRMLSIRVKTASAPRSTRGAREFMEAVRPRSAGRKPDRASRFDRRRELACPRPLRFRSAWKMWTIFNNDLDRAAAGGECVTQALIRCHPIG